MKKGLLSLLLLLNFISNAQKTDYLIAFRDTTKAGEPFGYKNKKGKVVFPAKYIAVYTQKFYTSAMVLDEGEWIAIDRKGKVILKPFIFDNGPDYIKEGLFRFVENGKMGFADIHCKKIIPATFDFVEPFNEGLAQYTMGGKKVYENAGEYWIWKGGYETGYINKIGKKVKSKRTKKQ